MLSRPCLKCGTPTRYPLAHCRKAPTRRGRRELPSSTQRGYNAEYRRNRRVVIEITWNQQLPCYLCHQIFLRKSDITCEHKIALRDGGSNDLSNLAGAHASCNKGWARDGSKTGIPRNARVRRK
jgi:hypothetical protein